MAGVAESIRGKLLAAFSPERLEVIDDSARHAGHQNVAAGGETHFTVEITSVAFAGVPRLQRQRQVYKVLASELEGPVHALTVKASAPGE